MQEREALPILMICSCGWRRCGEALQGLVRRAEFPANFHGRGHI